MKIIRPITGQLEVELMDIKQIRGFFTGEWAMAIGAVVVWCIAAFFLKKFVFAQIHKLTQKTVSRIDDIILDALNTPFNIAILFAGVSIFCGFAPLNPAVELYMNGATKAVIILCALFFIDRVVIGLLQEHDNRVPSVRLSQGVLQVLIRVIVYVVGGLTLLDTLGVNISPLVASLGVGSLAVALALKDTLANFFSGLFITMDKAVKVGDFVQLETGEIGTVEEIGWRSSRIRTPANNLVVLPNLRLVDSTVTNMSDPLPDLYVVVTCGVSYDSDLEHVERVVLDVAHDVIRDHPAAVKDQEPLFRFELFDASSINFRVALLCTKFGEHFMVQHELIKRIHARFREEGIVIPYPLQTLDLKPRHEELLRGMAESMKKN